mgnify:CR=1 FL=1
MHTRKRGGRGMEIQLICVGYAGSQPLTPHPQSGSAALPLWQWKNRAAPSCRKSNSLAGNQGIPALPQIQQSHLNENMKVDNLKEYIIRLLKRQLMFQEFIAVKDVSFKVYAGEALGIVGANGSGKSTILKAVSGIIKPYLGSIQVNGSLAPLIELGAGFDQEMTARENILLNGCILGHTEKFMRAHLDEIAEFAGASHDPH